MRHLPSAKRRAVAHLRQLTGRDYITLAGRAAAGIQAALQAWGFRNRVILVPANTCYIVVWAVLRSGNHPILIDVDPQTGNLTVEGLTEGLAFAPAAVIPCHMYGLTAPMREICAWGQVHGIKVIEDGALALGATVDGQAAGSWGDASILSFGLGKIADNQVGGALVTNDAAFARDVERILANAPLWDDGLLALTNQWNSLYWSLHQYETQNPRLLALYSPLFAIYGELTLYRLGEDEWQGLPKLLGNLPANLTHRANLTAVYDVHLSAISGGKDSTLIPALARPAGSILWRYPLLVDPAYRDDLLGYLWAQGIHDATRWYPALRPMATALSPDLIQPNTPAADALGASIINLPLDENTTAEDVLQIVSIIKGFIAGQ